MTDTRWQAHCHALELFFESPSELSRVRAIKTYIEWFKGFAHREPSEHLIEMIRVNLGRTLNISVAA